MRKLTFNHLAPNAKFYIEATANRPRGGPFIKLSATRYVDPSDNDRIRRMLFTDTHVSKAED